jgi:hypothetical protein
MIDRRTFLAGAAWCAAAGILRAQMNGTAPPGPSGLVRIKADRPTLLMGDEAAITGGAKPQIVDHGVVPSVNLEIYQDIGVGEASLDYMKAAKQAIKG